MKTLTNYERTLNILTNAIALGFDIDESETLENIRIEAEEYLIDNAEAIEEECEVESLGNRGQSVSWSDGMGFDFFSQGEIVDFRKHWFDAPETKVFHETLVDSLGRVIKLYYLVGKTDYNK